MCDCMQFPETVEEFMEQYKIVDTEQVYTNGTELVPIFRMQQWFEHLPAADVRPVVLCKDCQYYAEGFCYNPNSYDDDKSRGNTSPEWFCADGKLSKNYNCGADMREVPNGSP